MKHAHRRRVFCSMDTENSLPFFSTIFARMEATIDGTLYSCWWDWGESNIVRISKELWNDAYEFFIPPGQVLKEGNMVKVGPFDLEFLSEGMYEDTYWFRLVDTEQAGTYTYKEEENKWTRNN
jgi:hypothetical protein